MKAIKKVLMMSSVLFSMVIISFFAGVETVYARQDLMVRIIGCPASARPGQDLGASFRVGVAYRGGPPVRDVTVDIVLKKGPFRPTIPAPLAVYSPNFSDGVLLKGGREHVSLVSGQRLDVKLHGTNTIPVDTPPGDYYLCAVVDAGNKVEEVNEANNYACCRIRIVAR